MDTKIQFLGSLNQAVRILEDVAKKYKSIYDDSQLRLPATDITDIELNLKKAHGLLRDISLTNGEFRKIAK